MSVFRRLVTWEIRFTMGKDTKRVLCSCTKTKISVESFTKPHLQATPAREGKGRSFLIVRSEILRLLRAPMNPHDKLIFELPCLMGFRAHEVCTWRVEWIDFEHEDTLVLDSKKHVLSRVPANRIVLKHVEEATGGRDEGLVIENTSHRWRGRKEPLSTVATRYTWTHHATGLGLYPSPDEYSPIVGRRFFIAEYLRVHRNDSLALTLIDLMNIVRHSSPEVTWRYAQKIRFYEDEKEGYDVFQNSMEQAINQVPIQTLKVKN